MLVHAVRRRLPRVGLVTPVLALFVAAAVCTAPLPTQADPLAPTVTRTILRTPDGRTSVPIPSWDGFAYWPPSPRAINNVGQIAGETPTETASWVTEPALWQDGDDRATRLASSDAPAVAINDRGQVLIEPARVPEGEPLPGPTLWQDGEAEELPSSHRLPLDFNERGEVLLAKTDGDLELAVWAEGRITATLRPPRGADRFHGWDISDTGTVVGGVGYVTNPFFGSVHWEPFVWRDGRMTRFDVEGEANAVAVNRPGQVLVSTDEETSELLWSDGVLTELGLRVDTRGGPIDRVMNDQGQVVGTKDGRAHLWDDGRLIDLSTPEGTTSYAVAINERSQVVGMIQAADGTTRGFVWTSGHLLDLGPICSLCGGMAINDRGQIIGLSGDPLFVDDAAAVLWEVHDPAFPDSADDR